MVRVFAVTLVLLSLSNAQEIYVPTPGPTARPQCPTSTYSAPFFVTSTFAFTPNETVRTATSIVPPPTTTTYAAPYSALSSLVPSLSTTSWGSWDPNATVTANDTANPYGNAACTALWERAHLINYTFTGIYSTTVSPTPVPTSELVLPPADYFGPTDCYSFPQGLHFRSRRIRRSDRRCGCARGKDARAWGDFHPR